MYISITLTTKQTFQATNPKQNKPQSSLSNEFKQNDTVHSFNVKPTKMLSDPVAEAFGLIHRHPSGETFCRVWKQSVSDFKSCERTHFDHLLRSATLLHFMNMEYIRSNKGGRKLAFENNIYIKLKVLSNGTVWGDIMGGFCPGGFCPGGFCPRGILSRGILSGGVLSGGILS